MSTLKLDCIFQAYSMMPTVSTPHAHLLLWGWWDQKISIPGVLIASDSLAGQTVSPREKNVSRMTCSIMAERTFQEYPWRVTVDICPELRNSEIDTALVWHGINWEHHNHWETNTNCIKGTYITKQGFLSKSSHQTFGVHLAKSEHI